MFGATYSECLHLQTIEMKTFLYTTDQRAGNSFSISIGMYTLDDVTGVVAYLPDRLRNKTLFPANRREREFTANLVGHPVFSTDKNKILNKNKNKTHLHQPAHPRLGYV